MSSEGVGFVGQDSGSANDVSFPKTASSHAGVRAFAAGFTRLAYIDALKAAGIVMVVAVHVLTNIDLGQPTQTLASFLVGAAAVPLFFLADGFVFSWKWNATSQFDYWKFVQKSAKRLLVPWAAFTVLYITLRVALEWYDLTAEKIIFGKGFGDFIRVVYLSEVSPHMYFLLSLFVVRLATVGLYRILHWPFWIWASGSALYIVLYQFAHPKEWFLPGADPLLLALWGAQFYLLGIVLHKGDTFVREYVGSLLLVCLVTTFGLRYVSIANTGMLTQVMYLLAWYVGLLAITRRASWTFSLGKETMGVYLLHSPIVVWVAATLALRIIPWSQIVSFGAATGLTILVSWQFSKLMGKHRIGRVMLGQPEPSAS